MDAKEAAGEMLRMTHFLAAQQRVRDAKAELKSAEEALWQLLENREA
jgi:hypothetical protein